MKPPPMAHAAAPAQTLLIGVALLGLLTAAVGESVLLKPNPLSVQYLSVPDATKTLLRSGFDYNDGNYDSGNLVRVEPVGASFSNLNTRWVLFEAEGPGVVTSVWLTGKKKTGGAGIGGRLNFCFDGQSEPALSGLLPEALEDGTMFPRSLAEKSSGGWVSYAPIYFAKSLKITLSDHGDGYPHRRNGRGEAIPHLYHQFTWQRLSQPVASSTRASLRASPAWQRDEVGERGVQAVRLAEGARATVADFAGRGILNALRLRWTEGNPDRVRLRIVADERGLVDLEVPHFWGFASRSRPQARFRSLLMGWDEDGSHYCHFPMPHRQRLRLELSNEGGPVAARVETVHRPGWPEPEHFYFHAARVSDRTERGRDVKLLEATGGGHFVGTILELADPTLEGDDRFYVDGEAFPPAWHGTGTEDYFRCGWYFFGGPLTRPLYGLLDAGKPKIAYRFQVADRVNFTRSVVIGFEHGHGNQYVGPLAGVVFWYGE